MSASLSTPYLSVIYVNYYSEQLIVDSIKSIAAARPGFSYEIIVVNNSDEPSLELLYTTCPQAKVISAGGNIGFGRANNIGMRAAKGRFFLLLNGDTLVPEGALDHLLATLAEQPGYVAATAQLLGADGKPQISGSYFVKGGLNFLLPLPFIGETMRWLGKKMYRSNINVKETTAAVDVHWIAGACMLIRKETFTATNGFDEDFFLYAEEIEWCFRLRKTGKLCIAGQVNIIHLEGGSSNKAYETATNDYWWLCDAKGGQIMLSNLLFIRKSWGKLWFITHLLLQTFAVLFFYIKAISGAKLYGKKISLKDAAQYSKNVRKLLSLSKKILSGERGLYRFSI
jgi:GT2 family glycosyltransferase